MARRTMISEGSGFGEGWGAAGRGARPWVLFCSHPRRLPDRGGGADAARSLLCCRLHDSTGAWRRGPWVAQPLSWAPFLLPRLWTLPWHHGHCKRVGSDLVPPREVGSGPDPSSPCVLGFSLDKNAPGS